MSDKMIFQVPGYLVGIKTLANSWRVTFDTQETISSDAIKRFAELQNKLGWMTVSCRVIEPEDILDLPEIKTVEAGEKTPAQQLRAVLYVLWKYNNENFATDEEHYKYYMSKFKQHILSKLPRE